MADLEKKVVCNTKPVVDALDLGVINANISVHYRLSTLLQITGTKNLITMSTAAAGVLSEMKVKGLSEGIKDSEKVTALIDAEKFKSLMGTVDTNSVEIKFIDGGIELWAGSSRYVFPACVDANDYTLPTLSKSEPDAQVIDINVNNWKSILNSQTFALATSFLMPVYNYVWVGEDGTVLTGDMDISQFTKSNKGSDLPETCLVPDTILNLLAAVPDGAQIIKLSKMYQIHLVTDTFEYTSQFALKHESDEDVGDYNSDIILSQFEPSNNTFDVSVSALRKAINQIGIVSNIESNTKIDVSLEKNVLRVISSEVNVPIEVKVNDNTEDWKSTFYYKHLQKTVSHFDDDTIQVSPIVRDNEVAGLLMVGEELQIIIAGVQN